MDFRKRFLIARRAFRDRVRMERWSPDREMERWREGELERRSPDGDRERDGLLIGLRLRKISVNRHNLRGFKL